ncbi:unnamed protein product [Paramecium sonneborni]|uniref:Transmembrane protein n=1 Tax=Paramecium sonneborni TaxID=65129 RepID=A0A8S1QVP6_9CILI|nr:unnamed protein product [Paramecium sonneborni]
MNSKSQHQTHRKTSLQEQNSILKKPKNNNRNQFEFQEEIRSEFIIRQKEYEDLYKFHNYDTENLVNTPIRMDSHQSKFKSIINDAKLKFMNSYTYQNQNYLEKQQSSIKFIAEQQRNQKRLLKKDNSNTTQNINQINLNLILSLTIPILCFIVIFLEQLKKDQIII